MRLTVLEECRTKTLVLPEFRLESGALLREVEVTYEAHGTLNETGTNAVLVCHALTGDAQASQWWNGVVGRKQALDTERYFVICSNVLGGCIVLAEGIVEGFQRAAHGTRIDRIELSARPV